MYLAIKMLIFYSKCISKFWSIFLSGCGLALFLEKVLPDHKISEKIGSGISTKKNI